MLLLPVLYLYIGNILDRADDEKRRLRACRAISKVIRNNYKEIYTFQECTAFGSGC